MKALKFFEWFIVITLGLFFIGGIAYAVFSDPTTFSPTAKIIIFKILHIFKIISYVILILMVVGLIGWAIWFLLTRKKKEADGSESIWSGFSEKFLESIGNFFTSIGKIIVWMAKEAKVLFVLLIIGLSIWLTMEFAPRLAKKWAGVKPPPGIEWSTKQTMIANGWWPDGKKTVWFWQSSKSYPKLARTVDKEIGLIEAYDRHDQRRYELTNRLIDSGLYKMKTTTTTSTNESPSTSQTQKASIPNLDESLMTKRIKNSANAGVTASTGTSNTEWNMGSDKNPSIPDLKDNQMTKRFENASNQQ